MIGSKKNLTPILEARNAQANKANEIFRNQLYTEFFIIDKASYEESKEVSYELQFTDPYKQVKVSIQVTKKDFKMLKPGKVLSQIAAHYNIKTLEKANQSTKEVSVKYQVLSKQTAFIGVSKEVGKDKVISSTEMKQVSINELQRRGFWSNF